MEAQLSSANFGFLGVQDSQLVRLGALAERYFRDDPNTCLIKLRQFGETMAQQVAARTGALLSVEDSQSDLLRRFRKDGLVPNEALELFHHLRMIGNQATHAHAGTHAEALNALKVARGLAIWFYRTFGKAVGFKPGPFVPPPDPAAATAQLHVELERLRQELQVSQSAAQRAQAEAEAQARSRESAEERAQREAEDRALWEQLAQETEVEKVSLGVQLVTLQQAAQQAAPAERAALIEQGQAAARAIDLGEMATRALIDRQLRERGWDADSTTLRYANGDRPIKGKAMAIAEWPTDSGPADYALFIGLQCIAVVEAKRQRKNVSTAIDQAERYSKGFRLAPGTESVGGPWGEYRVPFVFATNGRPYLRQLETESGIWFRDVRRDINRRRALSGWFTAEGLKAELELDRVAAQTALETASFQFGFPLRPYQQRAIEKVERALATDQRNMLVAMATGTGKTKLAIALLYRLLNAKRFRRICFVVDRNALGEQTAGEFRTTKIVSAKTFAEIFDLKGLDKASVEPETKVHVCTIQGLVGRVLLPGDGKVSPPIDQYDLMVIDECHRGYLLDREMSESELVFRDQNDYVSKYRQVLEHFDAVKIGLTATPALHTAQIFGDPIYTYSYREAVIDGYLIDHEPPIRIETQLNENGIVFAKGEQVELLDTRTGQIDLAHMPDELQFEVEAFNRKVITRPFVAAIAGELARHIDPNLPGKTLIFAVSKGHADIIVEELKKALEALYGEIEDQAVRRITGDTDQVGALIRSYRNDDMPKIAVTVDLLTTGIDVPAITNLVFLRRVNSRILYEQMLARIIQCAPTARFTSGGRIHPGSCW
jgi:type I restriction enzyme R subunit